MIVYEVYYNWYHPPDYWNFTKHADKVNRDILERFEKAGIDIALPAFTTKLDDRSGLVPIPDRKGNPEI